MRLSDDRGTMTVLGVLISKLEYADDEGRHGSKCTQGIPPKGTRNEGTGKKKNPRYTSQIDNWSSDKTVDSQEDFT